MKKCPVWCGRENYGGCQTSYPVTVPCWGDEYNCYCTSACYVRGPQPIAELLDAAKRMRERALMPAGVGRSHGLEGDGSLVLELWHLGFDHTQQEKLPPNWRNGTVAAAEIAESLAWEGMPI